MSESKAVEDYKIFESLRNRFSDATSPPPRPEPRKASKRRFDPRNAPPLVPLIEEGDQLQEAMVSGSASPSRVKWKYTNQLKCNHLNGPDFDALDTSSTTSLSSAYSEPGTSSPVMGSSLSELSDAGSCETFSEYDIKRNKQLQSRIASLKASFEHSSLDQSQNRSPKHKNDSFDVDVSENFVHKNKRAWDRVIGDWVFNGVDPHLPASLLKPKMRPPSSEVRVPTPLSTPLGSTDNLLIDSGSRSSVLSTNDSIISSEDYTIGWNFEQMSYTRRSLSNFPRRPSSASCIQNKTKRQSLITIIKDDNRSSSETDLLLQMASLREPTQKDNAALEREGTEKELDEEVVYLQPKEYKMGKFLSISDTMLPAEERTHEYIAEGTKVSSQGDKKEEGREEENVVDEPIKDYSSQRSVTSTEQTPQAQEIKTEDESTEIPPDSAAMTEIRLGKFLSQNNTTSLPEEVNDVEADREKPTSLAITDSDDDKKSADEKASKTEESRLEPSNRWFDAYMKCKASQAKAGLVRKRIPPVIKEDPVKNPEKKEEAEVKEPPVNASQVNMDDFEKVQKITPSKSQKWREAMEKYKALEQKSTSQNPQASRGEEQSQNSVVQSPQKSAEEPSYSSLAQRAQVFGGMRKKPPLRRAKSFQIGSGENASSPLATGLTRPTRVLKRQMTASSFN